MSYPWKATCAVTYACNLKCIFCGIWKKKPDNELTADEWRLIFEKAPKLMWVDFTGGEPFIRNDLTHIIASCIERQKPFAVHVPTNGWLVDRIESVIPFASKTRLAVTVSIDGPEELHDRMRGRSGSWERAVESLRLLRRARIHAVAGMTLCKDNIDHIVETVAALKTKLPGFDEGGLHINLSQTSEHYYCNTEDVKESDYRLAASDMARLSPAMVKARMWPPSEALRTRLTRKYLELLPKFVRTGRTPMPCMSLKASFFISPAGDVHPCITDPRIVGRLRECEYDLTQIHSSKNALALRNEIMEGGCPHCWTPCEAFPTMIESNSLLRTVKNLTNIRFFEN